MKPIALMALSAAAILGASTISADAQRFRGGGFRGGGMGFHGGGFGGGFGGFRGGGFRPGFVGARFGNATRFGGVGIGMRPGFGGAGIGMRPGFGQRQFANAGWRGGWNRGGWNRGWRGGRGLGLVGLGGLGLGYGLGGGWGWGGGWGPGWGFDDFAYGGDPYFNGGYGYNDYAYDPYYAGRASYGGPVVVRTGRSAVSGGLGRYCTTPVKSCLLHSPSNLGGGCSCKVSGGRSRGQVSP